MRFSGRRADARALVVGFVLAVISTTASPASIKVLTNRENDTIPKDSVVLAIHGEISRPMAADLRSAWSALGSGYQRILLDLDSPGGSFAEMVAVIGALADIRDSGTRVDALVRHGAMCASACIGIFVQGEDRAAGGASVWLFHGVCHGHSNVPSLSLTDRYLDILREAGVRDAFLCDLVERGHVTTAGKLWISGYELFRIYRANIITRLLDPWRPEEPTLPYPMIKPR